MKKPKFLTKEQKVLRNASRTIHYYIDESGSPEFYGKKKKLLVGAEGYRACGAGQDIYQFQPRPSR